MGYLGGINLPWSCHFVMLSEVNEMLVSRYDLFGRRVVTRLAQAATHANLKKSVQLNYDQ